MSIFKIAEQTFTITEIIKVNVKKDKDFTYFKIVLKCQYLEDDCILIISYDKVISNLTEEMMISSKMSEMNIGPKLLYNLLTEDNSFINSLISSLISNLLSIERKDNSKKPTKERKHEYLTIRSITSSLISIKAIEFLPNNDLMTRLHEFPNKMNARLNNESLQKRIKLVNEARKKIRELERCGILHGDLNNRNIMFNEQDEARIIDFDRSIDCGRDIRKDIGNCFIGRKDNENNIKQIVINLKLKSTVDNSRHYDVLLASIYKDCQIKQLALQEQEKSLKLPQSLFSIFTDLKQYFFIDGHSVFYGTLYPYMNISENYFTGGLLWPFTKNNMENKMRKNTNIYKVPNNYNENAMMKLLNEINDNSNLNGGTSPLVKKVGVYRSKGGYYYRRYKNGKVKRISKEIYKKCK